MARKFILSIVASAALGAAVAVPAAFATPVPLALDQGAAFSVLGHSCGGIQEKVYVHGFAAEGYPEGNAQLSTTCGGSGRGGGGHGTTYTGSARVEWTWFGETRSYSAPASTLEVLEATDSHGDRVYNSGTSAYLETAAPPLKPPAPPSGVTASVLLNDQANQLQMDVGWQADPETARLLKSETATATPVGSTAPVLSNTLTPYFSSTVLAPVEPSTTYRVQVTATDAEGTSAPSAPIEIKSPNSDGEAEKATKKTESCAANSGAIKLSPGLTEKPAFQKIAVSGTMSGCSGPLGIESGSYSAKLRSTEALSCSSLSSASLEGTSSSSFTIQWVPAAEGASKGSFVIPISEAPMTGLKGSLSEGPFNSATAFAAGAVYETFTGAAGCGVPVGKKPAKPVKTGTFSTAEVEFG